MTRTNYSLSNSARKAPKKGSKRQRHEGEGSSLQPPAKKAKTAPQFKATTEPSHPVFGPPQTRQNESILQPGSESSPGPEKPDDPAGVNSVTLPPDLKELKSTHEVTTMSIISSSHIQKKVTRALNLLSLNAPVLPSPKPGIVVLHVKAKNASKMITVAEITKREMAQKGVTWFQYTYVGHTMEDQKENNVGKRKKVDEDAGAYEKEADSEDDDENFEHMKTPFERAIEGRQKVRAIPTMSIYLSRKRIDSLRSKYGEQTNEVL